MRSTTTDCAYSSWTLVPAGAGRGDDHAVIVVAENRLGTTGPTAFQADFVLTTTTQFTLTIPALHTDWPGLVKGGPDPSGHCTIDLTITGEP